MMISIGLLTVVMLIEIVVLVRYLTYLRERIDQLDEEMDSCLSRELRRKSK